ncbi:MAG: hypothetical protein EAZ60_11560 [Oscillatoriales cyanobacterium]|nr:MAG: hypothetical protein EAZ79_22980 [Oscillatoriales cyanobacterium]TAF36370.1 MAG: hypothetical protein EAZ69_10690 [Oscillatoriales cyanobacterium]TAF55891.1 MAG: hypothetical protein EAZ60_11560 [Oscillatoriales cyanobacterium]
MGFGLLVFYEIFFYLTAEGAEGAEEEKKKIFLVCSEDFSPFSSVCNEDFSFFSSVCSENFNPGCDF